jgi:DNA-binding transcriptional MerR regulator
MSASSRINQGDLIGEPQPQPQPQPQRAGTDAAPVPTGELYRTKEVVQILSISRRQLQYWSQTDLVVPSAKTPGGHHRYTFADLVALKATKRLIDAGVSVQRIRSSIQALRRILPRVERPLAELTLVATADVVLVFHEGIAFEAVSGQEWVFEVAQFEREVEAWRMLRTPRTVRSAKPAAGATVNPSANPTAKAPGELSRSA